MNNWILLPTKETSEVAMNAGFAALCFVLVVCPSNLPDQKVRSLSNFGVPRGSILLCFLCFCPLLARPCSTIRKCIWLGRHVGDNWFFQRAAAAPNSSVVCCSHSFETCSSVDHWNVYYESIKTTLSNTIVNKSNNLNTYLMSTRNNNETRK